MGPVEKSLSCCPVELADSFQMAFANTWEIGLLSVKGGGDNKFLTIAIGKLKGFLVCWVKSCHVHGVQCDNRCVLFRTFA